MWDSSSSLELAVVEFLGGVFGCGGAAVGRSGRTGAHSRALALQLPRVQDGGRERAGGGEPWLATAGAGIRRRARARPFRGQLQSADKDGRYPLLHVPGAALSLTPAHADESLVKASVLTLLEGRVTGRIVLFFNPADFKPTRIAQARIVAEEIRLGIRDSASAAFLALLRFANCPGGDAALQTSEGEIRTSAHYLASQSSVCAQILTDEGRLNFSEYKKVPAFFPVFCLELVLRSSRSLCYIGGGGDGDPGAVRSGVGAGAVAADGSEGGARGPRAHRPPQNAQALLHSRSPIRREGLSLRCKEQPQKCSQIIARDIEVCKQAG